MDSFLTEADEIKRKLPATFDAVYSSPSRRCTLLAEQLVQNFQIDNRLYEFNFGDWEGKTWDTIDRQESAAWMQDFVQIATPNGESMVQMNERVMAFWTDICQKAYKTVAVVTHGGVIRLLMAADQQLPLTSVFTLKVDYGEVVVLRPR